MSALKASGPRSRSDLKAVMSVAERIGMGMIYALVVAFVPLSAFGLWTRAWRGGRCRPRQARLCQGALVSGLGAAVG